MILIIAPFVKMLLSYYSQDAINVRKQKAMHEYLSQATDLIHLEQLERQWFKTYGI